MREILFRGKRIDNNEWIYGGISIFRGITDMFDKDSIDNSCEQVFDWSVGQFTGLLDKNGKQIFEGDVLKWKCSKSGRGKEKLYTVSIHWNTPNQHSYSLTIYSKGEKWATSKSYWNASDRELIGNIHDNPELLT
jgi:uncharacterized phage protein (TIGR01671 family)